MNPCNNTYEVPSSNVWKQFLVNNDLSDGVIHCNDGIDLKIHRVRMVVISPYFKALFTNALNSAQPEVVEANVNVGSTIMKTILDYCYTGHCQITESNVNSLLRVSDQYGIMGVVRLCSKFFMDNLKTSNCLGIHAFASHYFCKELADQTLMFAIHNFESVMKSEEFLKLSFQDLKKFLIYDELNIKTEAMLLDGIQAWINSRPERKQYIFELLKCVRVGHLNKITVQAMSNWSVIQESEDCMEFLKNAMLLKTNNFEQMCFATHHLYIFRPRIPYDILFAIGGYSTGSHTNFVETYDVRADRWLVSPHVDSVCRAYHGLVALNGLVYLIGGFDGTEYLNSVRCFDPVKHIWSARTYMHHPRCYVSVVVHDGKIYALGGHDGRSRVNSAERYITETNQWENIASMNLRRSDAGAAALGDKIYIAGGFNGLEVMNSAEFYSPSADQWTEIRPMRTARSGVSMVAFKNTLYVIGGFNGYTRLSTCEKISPDSSHCWVEFPEMTKARSNFAIAVLNDFIYVIGGFDGSDTMCHVEYFDQETNKWSDASSMNLVRSAFSACVVCSVSNAREYSYVEQIMFDE